MSAKSRTAAASSSSRRGFLKRAVLLAGAWLWPGVPLPAAGAPALPDRTRVLLEKSEFVYVSPLQSDRRESTCHGEVWFAWLDDSVVLITARTGWKGRALSRGLDTARIWVGDHGRWKGWFSHNEDFRRAPRFEARARIDRDPALLDRLMGVYSSKYPEEFSDWEKDMRAGFASGERWIVRYAPISFG